MEDKNHIRKKNIIQLIVVIAILVIGSSIISKYNFYSFTKSVRDKDETNFTRDDTVKYSEYKSYKMENEQYNDAMFSKVVDVKPNTPYKVTCMVKTENVQNENNLPSGGAQIAIKDTTESSKPITGTTDWTELTFMFNSKNRESVEIAFRLGGFEEKSKGTAWFSDFKIEEGTPDKNNIWNIAFFIIENVDVNIDLNNTGITTNYKFTMSEEDIYNLTESISSLPETVKEFSNNQMKMEYDVIIIEEPLTKISYDQENEYYVSPYDVEELIDKYLKKEEYDYIYVGVRLGDLKKSKEVLVHDWIGLGGMDYYGVGFSNIRLPDEANNYIYNVGLNTFAEEVFLHEFLHTLERNEKEYENENIIALHDYAKYGYEDNGVSQRAWYEVYMKNNIKNANGKTGLTSNIYSSKPPQESNFKYSYELSELKEPRNIIEKISILIEKMTALFNKK